jgi:hypothetical protein
MLPPPIVEEPPIGEEPPIVLDEDVIVYNKDLISNSLALVINNGGNTSYLVDKKGEEVFRWNFDKNLGNDFELLEDGTALGMFKAENREIGFGGSGGIIEIINPDMSIAWSYTLSTATQIAHHDVEQLPNGNLLFMVWEKIDLDTAIASGVATTNDIFPEQLIELNPETMQEVWSWRSWEHIVQEQDNTKPNFGVVADMPEKIDINYNADYAGGDIMHANGIEYDAQRDVIYISVNFYDEVWVIDHSTTSEEATTSQGGVHGKGGDLLYRFGNPLAYNNQEGTPTFNRNHAPRLIADGYPGAGNLLVYINGASIMQSTVVELAIPESFNLMPNTNNELPVVWSFTDNLLFNERISGADRLLNGNTLICEGDFGYWEVTQAGEIAWRYDPDGNYWRGYGYELDDPALGALGINF